MGLNTLTNRSAGQTILDTFFNDIHQAINSDFVGRNSSGVPTSGQSLGTTSIPWGTIRANSLVLNGDPVDTSQITSPPNRVISGKVRTTSNQPAFIVPTGSSASFRIMGSTTNLVLDVNGTSVTVNTDIAKTGLTTAASSQNTCAVNDADAAGQADTRLWGEPEHRKNSITVQTMGTNITALIGKWASFKMGTEYFFAFVESSTKLSKCMRGHYYDSAIAPLNRTVFSNAATITLMATGWVFVEDNGTTVDVSYNNPVWSYASPSSPVTGDYWYDLANREWKRYDGASFQIIDRTLVGKVVVDSTNCVAARCEDFFANYSSANTMELEVSTTEIARASRLNQRVSVAGNLINFQYGMPTWNITTNLASAADLYNSTEQASTMYYAYIKDTGETVLSDISPYFRGEQFGCYHPHNPWRCVGLVWNDASSNIVNAGGITDDAQDEIWYQGGTGFGSSSTRIRRFTSVNTNRGASIVGVQSATLGDVFTCYWPAKYAMNYCDYVGTGSQTVGISLNSNQLTTAISGITSAHALVSMLLGTNPSNAPTTTQLYIGDVVRAHHEAGTNGGTNAYSVGFRIAKVAA